MDVAIHGIGLLAPGLVGWEASRAVLAGLRPFQSGEAPDPEAVLLPPNERRRSSDWKYVPRPSTTTTVSTVTTRAAMANARNTRNQRRVSGRPTSANTEPTPMMIVVPTMYASRSSATAAVAWRASTVPDRSTTFSGSPAMPRSVR